MKDVARRLVDANSFKDRCALRKDARPSRAKPLADDHAKVFSCRYKLLKNGDFLVEIAMIERLYDLPFHEGVEVLNTGHATGLPVDWPADRHLNFVVVTVSVGVIALSIQLLVGLFGESLRMQPVRGAETVAARELH